MNFLCPSCRTPIARPAAEAVVPCTQCGVQVDLTRVDTAPGTARLWPDVDLTGEAVGGYELVRRIAAGGMGVVYEAQGPDGKCAVKVLSALLAAEPSLRERFRREAAALRTVRHEGVVRVLAEGEERGFCWYAMELVDGEDLSARLRRAPLPAAEVEALARRVLEALAAVHAAGFVHRDVKPGNILLAKTGPMLCDFGIARFDGRTTLTESAAVLGSLRYMAPEQRLGRTGPSADLYSLGVVLHEALSGTVPDEAPLPSSAPARLRTLVRRLLATRPEERPADARAALALLDRRFPARRVAAAAAVLLAAAVGVGASALRSPPPAAVAEPRPMEMQGPKEKEPVEQNAVVAKAAQPALANGLRVANQTAQPAKTADAAPAPQQATAELAQQDATNEAPTPNQKLLAPTPSAEPVKTVRGGKTATLKKSKVALPDDLGSTGLGTKAKPTRTKK